MIPPNRSIFCFRSYGYYSTGDEGLQSSHLPESAMASFILKMDKRNAIRLSDFITGLIRREDGLVHGRKDFCRLWVWSL